MASFAEGSKKVASTKIPVSAASTNDVLQFSGQCGRKVSLQSYLNYASILAFVKKTIYSGSYPNLMEILTPWLILHLCDFETASRCSSFESRSMLLMPR